jgi:MoxR-like ATPase
MVNKYPFLDKAPVLLVQQVYLPAAKIKTREFSDKERADLEKLVERVKSGGTLWTMPKVVNPWPLNDEVVDSDTLNPDQSRYYAYLAETEPEATIKVNLVKVDYQAIVDAIEIVEHKDEEVAYKFRYYDDELIELKTPESSEIIERILKGDLPDATNEVFTGRSLADFLNEAPLPSITKKTPDFKPKSSDPVEVIVGNYLDYGGDRERVPLLIGTTAVAKSAVVKAESTKRGMRLVDIRCGFVDKLDIEGLSKKHILPSGEVVSYQAAMAKLVYATDQFIDYAVAKAKQIEDYLLASADKVQPDEAAVLAKLLADFKFYSKPPVIFFDEVTRAPASVRQAFTVILNQKEFLGYSMKKAKVIAATNYPIGMDDRFANVFLTDQIEDAAILDRFESVVVAPEAVYPRWIEYVSDPQSGWHPSVPDFVKANGGASAAHNIALATDKLKDPDDLGFTPFPNFRSWQFVSEHLNAAQAYQNNKKQFPVFLDFGLIEGYLGSNDVYKNYRQHLIDNYGSLVAARRSSSKAWESVTNRKNIDELTGIILNTVGSGTPLLILGPSGYGKTTRIKLAAKAGNFRLMTLNLAQKDKTSVLGLPVSVPLTTAFTTPLERLSSQHPLLSDISDFSGFAVPPEVTTYAPDMTFMKELEAARKSGQKLIVFFDEITRAEATVASAVFEAISDNRLFGVEYAPGEVVVVAAANYGENYADANRLDPAFAARFSIYRKLKFDRSDIQAVMDYWDTEGMHPGVMAWARSIAGTSKPFEPVKASKDLNNAQLGYEQLGRIFLSVEQRTVAKSAASLRAFSDWNKLLQQASAFGDARFSGSLPPDSDLANEYSNIPRNTTSAAALVAPIESFLKTIPPNWAGFYSGKFLTLDDGKDYTVRDIYNGLRDELNQLKSGSYDSLSNEEFANLRDNLFSYCGQLLAVNNGVNTVRKSQIKAIFGTDSYADDIFESCNRYIGKTVLSIQDLVTPELTKQYFMSLYSHHPDPDSWRVQLLKDIDSFNALHGLNDWRANTLMELLAEMVTQPPFPDAMLEVIQSINSIDPVGKILREILQKGQNYDLTIKLLKAVGHPTYDEAKIKRFFTKVP